MMILLLQTGILILRVLAQSMSAVCSIPCAAKGTIANSDCPPPIREPRLCSNYSRVSYDRISQAARHIVPTKPERYHKPNQVYINYRMRPRHFKKKTAGPIRFLSQFSQFRRKSRLFPTLPDFGRHERMGSRGGFLLTEKGFPYTINRLGSSITMALWSPAKDRPVD